MQCDEVNQTVTEKWSAGWYNQHTHTQEAAPPYDPHSIIQDPLLEPIL